MVEKPAPKPDEKRDLALAPGVTTIHLPPAGEGAIRLRRFAAGEYPLVSEGIAGGSTSRLFVPADFAPQPWQLRVEAEPGAVVCHEKGRANG